MPFTFNFPSKPPKTTFPPFLGSGLPRPSYMSEHSCPRAASLPYPKSRFNLSRQLEAACREHLSTAALLTGTELCFPNMGAAQAADSLLRLHFPIAPSPQSPQGPCLCPPNHPTYPLPAASSPEMKVSPHPHAVCAITAGDGSACSSPPKTLPIQKTKQHKTKKPHSFSDTSSLLPWRTLHGCVCVEPAVPVPSLPGQTGCCSPLQGKSFFFYLFTSGSL